jgi:uncharacterized protein YndB with AHSA1/START domain
MVDIIHRIGINAPVSKVYEAVSTPAGVAGWWTKETTGKPGVGGAMTSVFHNPKGEEIGRMKFDLVKLEPGKKVQWRFTAGPEEWVGTDLTFDLSRDGDQTLIVFGHRNWREAVEFTAHCSMKWATFLLSLRELLETGKGKPSPNDLKIDNWN